jgi:hypothetical protein
VLLLTLAVSVIVVLGFVAVASSAHEHAKEARYKLDHTQALAVAEGVLEVARKSIQQDLASFRPPPTAGSATVAGRSYGYSVTELEVGAETPAAGGGETVQRFEISTSVEFGSAQVTLDRKADLSLTPVFQYMIYYNDDLEVLPGPDMTLQGRVHANGDIYVGCSGTLTVDSDLFHCTGKVFLRRKDNGNVPSGSVTIRVAGDTTYEDLLPGGDSTSPTWTQDALETWQGTVQDGSHGVERVAAPELGSVQAFEADGTKGHYHETAGLVIADGVARDGQGNVLSLPAGTVRETTMYDGREGKDVTVTEINLGLLNISGHFPANGIVYAYRTDASPSEPNGIRLTNGSSLLGPLTVVSEDPVYIRGDFNTVAKKPAAVIADAVNLLSNAWDDSKSEGELPEASDTTFNLAIATGNVPTPDGGGAYSGGFENLPRFHENWSGRRATIQGSFVNMFPSQFAVSPWRAGGDVYRPPLRTWTYESSFADALLRPPGTPNVVRLDYVSWDDHSPPLIAP